MPRFALLLAMALVQAQPLIGAMACEQHHTEMGPDCMEPGSTTSKSTPPGDHDCAAMAVCAPASPAVVPDFQLTLRLVGQRLVTPLVRDAAPPSALRTPPFHPPKA